MKNHRLLLPLVLIGIILLALLIISPAQVGHALPLADPTATEQGPKTSPGTPDPTPAQFTKTPEPTETPAPTETEPAPTATDTPAILPTDTPTGDPVTGTAPVASATATDTPPATATGAIGTATPSPSSSPTHTPTPTLTSTSPALTPSSSPSPTPTITPSVIPSVTPGSPVPTNTRPPVEIPTDTPTPTLTHTPVVDPEDTATPGPTVTPTEPAVVFVQSPTGTVKLREGYEAAPAAYIVGLMRFPSLHRRMPIGLGYFKNGDRVLRHAEHVAVKVSDDDIGIHQKGAPWLANLKLGAIVTRGDGPRDIKYQVIRVVTVVGHNQYWMDYWLSRYATITTCTPNGWHDSVVYLMREIDQRAK